MSPRLFERGSDRYLRDAVRDGVVPEAGFRLMAGFRVGRIVIRRDLEVGKVGMEICRLDIAMRSSEIAI